MATSYSGSGYLAEELGKHGYFFGGIQPQWFDTDGFLMQKTNFMPNFDVIKLRSQRAKKILEYIKADHAKNVAVK
ncbi:MAG TPA: hypothetical protein PKK26_06460 [Candidatus Wallbacteria bacterium]|nr:hypothetical protein [Candidatus Wallbacteria bacterium]